jgi:hypothetical protein
MKTLKIVLNLGLAALLVWFLVRHEQKIRAGISGRDSIQYWAAGKLLVHRQNPYSVSEVQRLESSQGYPANRPLMLRTPPWSVWMTLPVGLLSSYWAWVAWEAILLASLVISMRISWRMYGDGPRPPNVFLLAGYLFAPVAACLVAGQIGMVLLLGISLFFLLEQERPLLAGTALLLPMAKPHIFILVWLILAVWIVARKKWMLLGAISAALLLAILIAIAFDPAIFQHYREMLHQQAIQNEFIPALSGMIRVLFFRRLFWVQFVPMALGLLWSLWYYSRNREMWSWLTHGPALLIVSLLTTPYSWMTDEVVLLPAILQSVLWLKRARLKARSQLLIVLFALLDLLLLLIVRAQIPPATGIYFWSSLVWFSWYWYARSFSHPANEKIRTPMVERGSCA